MGCCNSKREHTNMQLSLQSNGIRHTSEFNEIHLDSLPKGENIEKKLNSTVGSAVSSCGLTGRKKDLESAFLVPTVHRQPINYFT